MSSANRCIRFHVQNYGPAGKIGAPASYDLRKINTVITSLAREHIIMYKPPKEGQPIEEVTFATVKRNLNPCAIAALTGYKPMDKKTIKDAARHAAAEAAGRAARNAAKAAPGSRL